MSQVYTIRFPKDNLPNTKNVVNVAIDAVLAAMVTNQLQQHHFILPLSYEVLQQAVLTPPNQRDTRHAMMNMKKLVKEVLIEEFHATSLTAEVSTTYRESVLNLNNLLAVRQYFDSKAIPDRNLQYQCD